MLVLIRGFLLYLSEGPSLESLENFKWQRYCCFQSILLSKNSAEFDRSSSRNNWTVIPSLHYEVGDLIAQRAKTQEDCFTQQIRVHSAQNPQLGDLLENFSKLFLREILFGAEY